MQSLKDFFTSVVSLRAHVYYKYSHVGACILYFLLSNMQFNLLSDLHDFVCYAISLEISGY